VLFLASFSTVRGGSPVLHKRGVEIPARYSVFHVKHFRQINVFDPFPRLR
jgi:hypothetical protein